MIRRYIWYSATIILLGSVLMVQGNPPPAARTRELLPTDEAAKDSSFLAFRQLVIKILEKKDSKALLLILDPDISSSFGSGGGVRQFREHWRIDLPDSDVWPVLKTVLSMGGTFVSKDQFCAPYVFTCFPEDLESFEWVALIAADVPVRSWPNADAPIITRLSYRLVRTIGASQHGRWTHIEVGGAGNGFVESASVRSPVDWRACFSRRKDGWVMDSLVAGD